MASSAIGIWLIGAKGGVATTTLVGLSALKQGLVPEVGLVSCLPRFAHLGPADWEDFVDAYSQDCESECFDDDYPDDPNPWDEFYSDFMEDFSEHYSNGEGGGGGDTDTDGDCDWDAFEDCGYDYTDCLAECADQECMDWCLDDFCWCAEAAGCDASAYGC